jgi:hypothetical protein
MTFQLQIGDFLPFLKGGASQVRRSPRPKITPRRRRRPFLSSSTLHLSFHKTDHAYFCQPTVLLDDPTHQQRCLLVGHIQDFLGLIERAIVSLE